MAASSAITSLDLYRRLSASHQVTMRASDYYDAIHLVRAVLWHVSFDVEGHPIQVEGPLRRPLKRLVVRYARAGLKAGRAERLSLFHPSARAIAARDPHFQLAKESFFSPLAHRYHVVRVMNALIEQHLSRDRIEAALRAIIPTVAERGLLVLGRNADEEDGRIQATIFARGRDAFFALHDMSEGYSMKAVVLALSRSYP